MLKLWSLSFLFFYSLHTHFNCHASTLSPHPAPLKHWLCRFSNLISLAVDKNSRFPLVFRSLLLLRTNKKKNLWTKWLTNHWKWHLVLAEPVFDNAMKRSKIFALQQPEWKASRPHCRVLPTEGVRSHTPFRYDVIQSIYYFFLLRS